MARIRSTSKFRDSGHLRKSALKLCYQIQLCIGVYRDGKLVYQNEMKVPVRYPDSVQARRHIESDIEYRLNHSLFFRSPRPDYDIVKYSEEATCNTYLRYSVLEVLED